MIGGSGSRKTNLIFHQRDTDKMYSHAKDKTKYKL